MRIEKEKNRKRKKEEDLLNFQAEMRKEKGKTRRKKRKDDYIQYQEDMKKEQRRTRRNQKDENPILHKVKQRIQKQNYRKCNSALKRRIFFLNSIQGGLIYECVCCHRRFFKTGVRELQDEFDKQIEEKYPGVYNKSIGEIVTKPIGGIFYICFTCNAAIVKGKVPGMSHKNKLDVFDVTGYQEFNLTELQNSLIALNLPFMKFFLLPRSRLRGIRDHIINIPLEEEDVKKTILRIPRTFEEAKLVPISFKRRLCYNHPYMKEYIDTEKIIKTLETLKSLNNPFYQFSIPTEEEYSARLKECRARRQTISTKESEDEKTLSEANVSSEDSSSDEYKPPSSELSFDSSSDDETELSENELEDLDDEDKKQHANYTSVNQQFDYLSSTTYANDCPEIDVDENVSVAPGEGKKPTNVLLSKNWEVKSFPTLFPDGKNGLNENRESKLSDQQYFAQRILNKDLRFANNVPYIFSAMGYIEKKQLQSQVNISFMRG